MKEIDEILNKYNINRADHDLIKAELLVLFNVSGSLSFRAQKRNRRTLIACIIANEKTKLGRHPESKGVSRLTEKIIEMVYGNDR